MVEGPGLLVLLLLAVLLIIFATAVMNIHPFLVLLVASYFVGIFAGMSGSETISAITDGFGGTLGSIGIVIAAGTIIGVILEKSGGTMVMANTVLKWVGQARSALAMSITGAVVSIPVFCDSGFIILSSLNRSLASRANKSLAIYAVALSMGLYTTHVFVPPTPGPIAAAGTLQADLGAVILLGIITTIPVITVTYFFAKYIGSRIFIDPDDVELAKEHDEENTVKTGNSPSVFLSFLPIMLPMLLISIRSVLRFPALEIPESGIATLFIFLGDPNTALIIGVFLAFFTASRSPKVVLGDWVSTGLKSAGSIILITGAGGAFGSVLRATPIGDFLGNSMAQWNLGILLPFIIAAAIKTAQGSSTVAIITTASIMVPLLSPIGLGSGLGPVLVTLAIGAGAMTVSHANDSYFWVVSQFSGMEVSQAYRLQTLSSAVAGVTGIVTIFIISFFI